MFTTIDDGVSEGDETLTLTVTNVTGAAVHSSIAHTATITESNLPPTLDLRVSQAGEQRNQVSQDGGTVTLQIRANDPNLDDQLAYAWTDSSAELNLEAETSANVAIEPVDLSPGLYRVRATATDNADNPLSTSRNLTLQVVESLAALAAGDDDGDGVDNVTEAAMTLMKTVFLIISIIRANQPCCPRALRMLSHKQTRVPGLPWVKPLSSLAPIPPISARLI